VVAWLHSPPDDELKRHTETEKIYMKYKIKDKI